MAQPGLVLFSLGFRPFFLAASWFGVVAMLVWVVAYSFGLSPTLGNVPAVIWHGHEMIFGYSAAVLSGFLLTSVRNWTGLPTPTGVHLALIIGCWLVARAAFLVGSDSAIIVACMADLLFMVLFIWGISRPIIAVKQWRQAGIIAKLVTLLLSNLLFYAGLFGYSAEGVSWGLYSGLYMVLALILALVRRVFPFFVSMATAKKVVLKNYLWLDRLSLVFFFCFWIVSVFFHEPIAAAILAGSLALLHGVRMISWCAREIWRQPLLWVIYLAYGFIVIGFLLQAAAPWLMTQLLSLHAFAVGGIGLATIGMMARVALGHSGRDVYAPRKGLAVIFCLLIFSALNRTLLPFFWPEFYGQLIFIAQVCWIVSFAWFIAIYTPILLQPRIDGQLE